MSKPFYIELPNHGLIHIEGADRVDFLQGLITNDVTKLEEKKILYACLLTPQGKFLHDFFMHWGDGFILLDCEGGDRAQDLYTRLNRYRLRSNVQLSVEEDHKTYAVFGEDIGLPDPRHNALGNRTFEKPDAEEKPFEEWDKLRIHHKIPDGSRDMIVDKSLPLECGLDKLNALDWDKGCYMGQELTARMHYRNLGKKRLQALEFNNTPPAPFDDITLNDKTIGQMRSSCGTIGLALIKDEYLDALQSNENSLRLLGQ
ncbi:MAG: folate-binding protein [Pseudomonadota bacterium]